MVIVFVFLFGCCDVVGMEQVAVAQNIPDAVIMTAEQRIGLLKNELIGQAPEQGDDNRKLVFIGIERRDEPVVDYNSGDNLFIPNFDGIESLLKYLINDDERVNANSRFDNMNDMLSICKRDLDNAKLKLEESKTHLEQQVNTLKKENKRILEGKWQITKSFILKYSKKIKNRNVAIQHKQNEISRLETLIKNIDDKKQKLANNSEKHQASHQQFMAKINLVSEELQKIDSHSFTCISFEEYFFNSPAIISLFEKKTCSNVQYN